jgi:hypothetical protein
MTPRDVIEQMDAGRRATTLVLQRLDVGLDPVAVIREVSPTLSPIAVEAARRLVELCAFHFAATAMVLTGMVPDSLLEVAEIPESPARAARRGPDEIAAVVARRLGCPPPLWHQRTTTSDHHRRLHDPLQRPQGGGRGPGARCCEWN